MSSTFPSKTTLNPQHPNEKDFTLLYQEIGDYVIIKAHSGDPLFERVFESAWNKVSSKQNNAGSTGDQALEPADKSVVESNGKNIRQDL